MVIDIEILKLILCILLLWYFFIESLKAIALEQNYSKLLLCWIMIDLNMWTCCNIIDKIWS